MAALAALILCTTMAWAAVLPVKNSFVLAIGQKTAIYLVRGDCTGPVPSFSAVSAELPKTNLGK